MAQEKGRATIYDVAERAGVAISTVSRVLNNSNDVSEITRLRVLRAIDDLQFRPDRTAKSLAHKQASTLAIATPTFTTPFHNELLKGVRLCLRNHDIDLLLCDLGSSGPHATLLSFLKRGTVDGLLLAGLPANEAVAAELRALQAPVVVVGYPWEGFDSYYWDDTTGARGAVEHLIHQGHRRIAMIRSAVTSLLQERRIEGYRTALEGAGLRFDESIVRSGTTAKHAGFSEEAGYEAMEGLLREHPDVTAVFASSDVQAIGAWKAIRDGGKSVPQDMALVGYDDIKTSQFIGLSSVDQDMHDVGQAAAERLIKRITGEETGAPMSEVMRPTLNVRESSRFNRNP